MADRWDNRLVASAASARPGRFARYRFRAAFRQDAGSYLALVVLIGLVGGVAMASVAAARRTQSAFTRIIAASNPSNLDVDPGPYSTDAIRAISHLPLVTSAETYVALVGLRASPSGFANQATPFNQAVELVGSLDGLYFHQDQVIIVRGRRADPSRADEAVVSDQTARRFGLHVGQRLTINLYSQKQQYDPRFNPGTMPPIHRVALRITGIGVFTDEVVQDDIDRIDRVLATPALTKKEISCCTSYIWMGLRLAHGDRDVPQVQREYLRLLPAGDQEAFRVTSIVKGQGERAVRPESIAIGVFGLICGLAVLVLALQAIRRQIYIHGRERATLRALGAGPSALAADGSLGIFCAICVGTLLAMALAVAASPLAPIGELHRLEVNPGISFDWTVLGAGALVLVAGLAGATVLLAYRAASHRPLGSERGDDLGRRSSVAAGAAAWGLPVSAVTGIRFAIEPGSRRTAVPARSGIVGAVLALIILVASLVFGASLSNLVTHPRLYGWNWNSELLAGSGYGNIPAALAARLLGHDPSVAAWSGAYFDSLEIDGLNVPVIAVQPGARVGPPILSGHAVAGPREIVFGAQTLALLGKHVGDSVRVLAGRRPTILRIVGTATIPTIGIGHGVHPSLGMGALLPAGVLPPAVLANGISDPGLRGPNTILVRLRPGADPVAAARRLDQIAARLATRTALSVQVVPVQRPAEIVNNRTMGAAPLYLAAVLAAGAVLALALTLMASVRRRSRELAMLKTLGLVRRQLVAIVVWQATLPVAIGVLVGIPLGITAGRFLWTLFAGELFVVSEPAVPTLAIAGAAAGALALGALVAIVPGWRAARTPTGSALRAE
jgi:hypothetical protein